MIKFCSSVFLYFSISLFFFSGNLSAQLSYCHDFSTFSRSYNINQNIVDPQYDSLNHVYITTPRKLYKLDENFYELWSHEILGTSEADNLIPNRNQDTYVNPEGFVFSVLPVSKDIGDSVQYKMITSKFSPDGDVLWTISITGYFEFLVQSTDIIELNNGVIIIRGFYGQSPFDEVFVLGLSPAGAPLWQLRMSVPGEIDVNYHEIEKFSDDDFLIGGLVGSNNQKRPFLIRMDSNGNILWSRKMMTFSPSMDFAILSNDDVILIAASPTTNLFRISGSGDLLSSHFYEPHVSIFAANIIKDIIRLSNDGWIITSNKLSGTREFIATRFSPAGQIEWSYSYGRPERDILALASTANKNGEILHSGIQSPFTGTYNFFYTKTCPNGYTQGCNIFEANPLLQVDSSSLDTLMLTIQNFEIEVENSSLILAEASPLDYFIPCTSVIDFEADSLRITCNPAEVSFEVCNLGDTTLVESNLPFCIYRGNPIYGAADILYCGEEAISLAAFKCQRISISLEIDFTDSLFVLLNDTGLPTAPGSWDDFPVPEMEESYYPNNLSGNLFRQPEISLPDDVSIYLGESYEIIPLNPQDAYSYQWSPPDFLDCTNCVSTTSTPLSPISYELLISDENGCTDNDQITITPVLEPLLEIPNVITPGSNDQNADFQLITPENLSYKVNFCVIYDRWGALIYRVQNTDSEAIRWDGRKNGEVLPSDTFIYLLEFEDILGNKYLRQGDFTLIR